MSKFLWAIALCCLSCTAVKHEPNMKDTSWKTQLDATLPLLGHRNWILVVDKAFPLQTAQGIEVIYTGEKMLPVVSYVVNAVNQADHVSGIFYVDRELQYMSDTLCNGVEAYREALMGVVSAAQIIPHDEVFKLIDNASTLFKVLVLKTDELIPYSSVFINLDCGYWNPEKEKLLRKKIS